MFERPANLFVAGFIGSPGMNFLTAQAQAGIARLFGDSVPVPRQAEGAVTIGLRPEHIEAGPGAVTFVASPSLVESLGSEKYIYFDAPGDNPFPGSLKLSDEDRRGNRLIARLVNSGPVRIGEPVTLSFDPARLHVFDPATGRSIR